MRHAGFAQTTYLLWQTDQTNRCLSGLSLLSFRYILKKKVYFSLTAKVHVRLSKFGDRLPQNPKEKTQALCNRCVL